MNNGEHSHGEHKHGEHKFGWVALMGPPNAGKSTLLNALMGQKVTIVTPKPQTTRNQIVGILTEPGMQAVFMDTPGLSQGRGSLSKSMMQAVYESLRQADVIVTVLDSGDGRPQIVVANKVDLYGDKSRMLPFLTELGRIWPSAEIFPMSALQKDGVAELKTLLAERLPEGAAQFPEEQISTLPVRFMVSEIIREKLFLYLHEEVPYCTAVDIEKWDEDEKAGMTTIYATIYVTRPMHKAMVIGRSGATIKQIGIEARRDIQELIGGKVNLQLWVKIKDDWRNRQSVLNELGYEG